MDRSSKSDANRRIHINRRLNELKELAKANLDSEKGKGVRSKRPVEVESVFGDIIAICIIVSMKFKAKTMIVTRKNLFIILQTAIKVNFVL